MVIVNDMLKQGNEYTSVFGEAYKPKYKSRDAAGADLVACIENPITIEPNQVATIPLGVALCPLTRGYAAILLPRSSSGIPNGLPVLANGTGLIDPDYQGELIMKAYNPTALPMVINPLDRVCQIVVIPVVQAIFLTVDKFDQPSERGANGFGSTGRN